MISKTEQNAAQAFLGLKIGIFDRPQKIVSGSKGLRVKNNFYCGSFCQNCDIWPKTKNGNEIISKSKTLLAILFGDFIKNWGQVGALGFF